MTLTAERLAVCYARVRAQHMGASHVTYEALEELLQRLRDGDDEGRLPGEEGYVEPPTPSFV